MSQSANGSDMCFVDGWFRCCLCMNENVIISPKQVCDRNIDCFIMIITIFHCVFMVHITDTRAQKVVSYTSAHITETVFPHDQHREEQSTLSSPQLYRQSQEDRKWITIQKRITQPVLVRVQP